MYPMHLITLITLLLTLILALIPGIFAYPAYYDVDRIVDSPIDSIDRLDDDYYVTYPQQRQPVRRSDNSLGNLHNGYYYVDNGSVTPVRLSGQRRQDYDLNNVDTNDLPNGVKFTPLVRYKQTQTHRKKLFVPNFFG